MADEPKLVEMPATGGSYTRDAKTGALTRVEEPTIQEPGGETSVPAPDEAAAEVPVVPAKKSKET